MWSSRISGPQLLVVKTEHRRLTKTLFFGTRYCPSEIEKIVKIPKEELLKTLEHNKMSVSYAHEDSLSGGYDLSWISKFRCTMCGAELVSLEHILDSSHLVWTANKTISKNHSHLSANKRTIYSGIDDSFGDIGIKLSTSNLRRLNKISPKIFKMCFLINKKKDRVMFGCDARTLFREEVVCSSDSRKLIFSINRILNMGADKDLEIKMVRYMNYLPALSQLMQKHLGRPEYGRPLDHSPLKRVIEIISDLPDVPTQASLRKVEFAVLLNELDDA